jgi:hypothetical protein
MRGMMSPPRDFRSDAGHGTLHTIDSQREEWTSMVSARAG